ncbi:uncharacterized protein LOC118447982 [Vespa mandarinia]|uniref:uncharacterized protein LOC118447982 n=1 Tax=Vespa mandarinia TaxID=7446 RepID=UPI0016228CCE|nr:uncharacterized protein LOC118447982 [Vespa mandarinia]
MYPGRSSWARGVLALGAGSLLLLALQWRIDEIRGEEGGTTTSTWDIKERDVENGDLENRAIARSTITTIENDKNEKVTFAYQWSNIRIKRENEKKSNGKDHRHKDDKRSSWFSSTMDRSIDDREEEIVTSGLSSRKQNNINKNDVDDDDDDDNDILFPTSSPIEQKIKDDIEENNFLLPDQGVSLPIERSLHLSRANEGEDPTLGRSTKHFTGMQKDRMPFFRENLSRSFNELKRDDNNHKYVNSKNVMSSNFSSNEKFPNKTINSIKNNKKSLIVRLSHSFTLDRRKRYTNYYSLQSAIPMAYVHIQPSYPVAPSPPPPSRKCIRCMVVYKPCPSPPRQPPRIVLPTYKYQEPASKWHGLKYGTSR